MAQAADGTMVHVTVPEGVVEGGTFNHLMPNGMIVPVVVPPGASAGSVLAIPVPAVTAPALAPARPIRWTRKVRVNTQPVDGMRGFAVMHIILGHFCHMIDTGVGPGAPPEPAAVAWPETEACPAGWGLHKGMCYFGTCNRKPWEDANAMCGDLAAGATLASLDQSQVVLVDGRGKIDRVQEAWFHGGVYYIGLNERETKGTWAWANGTVAEDLVWAKGEPNDFGGTSEECGVAQVETNAFLDVPCHAEMPYLCSVSARAGLCQGDCTDDDFWEGAPYAKCEYHLEEGAECAQGTIALMGGGSMGFFYIISGFVMVVGYAQLPLRGARTWRESVCCPSCDRICCFPCGAGENEEDIDSLPALDARGFLRKRFARLAPMYFLTMILGVVIRGAIGRLGDRLEADPVEVGTTIVLSLFGMTSWFLSFPFCAEWLWTISTMMFFYLCFPALAPRVQRIKPTNLRAFALGMFCLQAAALILVGAVFGWVFGSLLYVGYWDVGYWARMYPPVRLPIFVMGMCCGMQRLHAEHARGECESQGQGHGHAEQPKPEPAQQVCPVIAPLAGCCCLQPVTGLGIYWLLSTLICASIAFACSGLWMLRALLELLYPILFYDWILAATDPEQQKSLIAKFFASRPMTFLGDISMCMYMLHLHVQTAMSHLLGGEEEKLPIWALLVEVAVSVLLGWLFTRFYEKPMAHLLRPRESEKRVGATEGSAQGLRTTPGEAPSPDVVGAPTTVAVTSKS